MATTESRSGFRLPWSADRAPFRDGSDAFIEDDPQRGDPAQETGAAGPLETALGSTGTPGTIPAPEDRSVPPVMPPKRPTKFLTDLIHAVQAAAEQARAATLEQYHVEGSSFVEQIQGRSLADADALRRRADDDIASIKDWSKTEIARIREETENRVAGRRGQLEGQLARHAALVERDVARIEEQIASFEARMAGFFDELLAETDLTTLAAHAQQMPEAPAFAEVDDAAFTALLSEPPVGIPPATPIARAETAEPETIADGAEAALDAARAAIQVDAEATASDEVASAEVARSEGAGDASVAADDVAETGAEDSVSQAVDSRLAMLGLSPDFAAAEAAAAEAAAAEAAAAETPEFAETNYAARLAGLLPASDSGTSADPTSAAPVTSTQVVVTGLVSVASIASFKRHLSREAGVRRVSVSSGPDGEFVFTVQHEGSVSLRDLIPALPGFQARVTGGTDGVVTASAHDPEN